jgi:hypothetical protein
VALGMLAMLWLSACGGQAPTTPGASGATSTAAATPETTAGQTAVPSDGASTAPAPPSVPPATPAPTAILNPGFQFGDILKVQVNSLAARIAPKRTAALVHAYDISGPAPVDGGTVRLDKGDFVSVELGPLPVGDTVWYLVWPAPGSRLRPGGMEWYTTPPLAGAPGPAWIAASVGGDVYMQLERHPALSEIEAAFGSVGVTGAGLGSYVSPPQPRHDGFELGWGAATTASGTDCSVKVALVPSDTDFEPKVAVTTTTTTVKVGPLDNVRVSAPWLPAAAGSWETFTVNVTGSCNWAFRLFRLEHD